MIVVVSLDPYATRDGVVHLDLEALGLQHPGADVPVMEVTDELGGETYYWNAHPYVRLDPHGRCAHVLSVRAL